MTEKIKNYLGVAIIAGVLMVGWAAISYASYYGRSIQPSSFRSFAVTGDGKAVGVPDVAQFTFSVITEGGKDIAALQKKNTDETNGAIAFVKSKGVDSKDVKTEGYDVSPRYEYCNYPPLGGAKTCPPPTIVGYTITQTVSVKIRKFENVGDIISGVVSNGANETSQLTFKVDDPTSLQDQARAEAIAKAKESAQSVAKAGGFSLGRLLSIEEGGSIPTPRYFEALGKGGAMAPAAAPTIEPGSQEVNVSVTLKYEIE